MNQKIALMLEKIRAEKTSEAEAIADEIMEDMGYNLLYYEVGLAMDETDATLQEKEAMRGLLQKAGLKCHEKDGKHQCPRVNNELYEYTIRSGTEEGDVVAVKNRQKEIILKLFSTAEHNEILFTNCYEKTQDLMEQLQEQTELTLKIVVL